MQVLETLLKKKTLEDAWIQVNDKIYGVHYS